jgi:ribonuclease E
MPKRMLVDASHTEETRVVVLDGNKVEEFDFEAASKRPLKGNIYLAKVTRVEPSLQAAFVEYGGNRQGFLAFSEIHPDYYQIPVADRMALLADQSRRLMAEDDFESVRTAKPSQAPVKEAEHFVEDNAPPEMTAAQRDEAQHDEAQEEEPDGDEAEDAAEEEEAEEHRDAAPIEAEMVTETRRAEEHAAAEETPDRASENAKDSRIAESVSGEGEEGVDETETVAEVEAEEGEAPVAEPVTVQAEATGAPVAYERREPRQRPPRRRQYKIQEVIKRRQVMLVQVVKEERGNKGASLTTYLSLAGRYCVLMPNTPRGGGISRKITSATDRRRLKSAAQSLELPEGMGLIIRTAGANRTKVEIRRDYDYLLRLWDSVRELTLKSNAPALVYEEGNLIKRAIRDLYNKDISEIVVDGESGYRDAKDFMRMLMPSHAKNVKPYKETLPLYQRFGVEAQLDAMFSPTVTLRSGGYIVINQTEALVSIDVNSGKATREHSIEETAYKTNCEAADEIGRQLRLRDLAGLIVIDFIDMEDSKNDRNVEKRLRDAVRNDRARVQIGKISQFGLLEMSRQRLRAGVVAGSTVTCPHCNGIGLVRSTESAALRLLRTLDEEGQRQPGANFTVKAPEDIVIFTLNQKRREVARIEDAYELAITFSPQLGMAGGSFEIERTGMRAVIAHPKPAGHAASLAASYEKEAEDEAKDVTIVEPPAREAEPAFEQASDERHAEPEHHARSHGDRQTHDRHHGGDRPQGEGGDARRRRRRRRRGGRGRHGEFQQDNHVQNVGAERSGDALANGNGETAETAPAGDEMAQAQTQPQQQQRSHPQQGENREEGGRRRRRRRGRRGRHRDGDGQDFSRGGAPRSDGSAPGFAEIPGASSAEGEAQVPIAGFGIAPNAPSSPQWSLHPGDDESRDVERPVQEPREAEPGVRETEAPADKEAVQSAGEPEPRRKESASAPAAEAEPGPRRGGWWQRRFKS